MKVKMSSLKPGDEFSCNGIGEEGDTFVVVDNYHELVEKPRLVQVYMCLDNNRLYASETDYSVFLLKCKDLKQTRLCDLKPGTVWYDGPDKSREFVAVDVNGEIWYTINHKVIQPIVHNQPVWVKA